MLEKKKRPGTDRCDQRPRGKGKTAGDTESTPNRPKQDQKGQGRSGGAKMRRAKGE
jgi:hypothetical protein